MKTFLWKPIFPQWLTDNVDRVYVPLNEIKYRYLRVYRFNVAIPIKKVIFFDAQGIHTGGTNGWLLISEITAYPYTGSGNLENKTD